MFNRFAISHPELGVYLGNAMGLGFWSKLDSAGQEHAVVFESKGQAEYHVKKWDQEDDQISFDSLMIVPILTANDMYATIAECEAAGLDAWAVEEYTLEVNSDNARTMLQPPVSGLLH